MNTPLASMTGFGRSAGLAGARAWSWELRSVNARGLDVRLKLPPGWDAQEAAYRQAIAAALKRGAIQAQLVFTQEATSGVSVRMDVLDRLLTLATDLAARIPGAPPPRAEALLALPGVLRAGVEPDAAADPPALAAVASGLDQALAVLVAARNAEGARLGAVLAGQVAEIATLATAARTEAAAQHEAQYRRLQESLRDLLGEAAPLDPARLAQEMALLASRADVREELDRLDSHIEQARTLMAEGAQAGRRLDFLVQEFNREANTLCSKSATAALTATGLRLKGVIEQLREQVQNIE